MDELEDPGTVMAVPEDERLDTDPDTRTDPTHAALGDGGPDDVSDVEEGEVVSPEDFVDDPDEGETPLDPSGDHTSAEEDGGSEDD